MAAPTKTVDGNGPFKYGERIVLTKDPNVWKRFSRQYGHLKGSDIFRKDAYCVKYNLANLSILQDDIGNPVKGIVIGDTPDHPTSHYPIELFTKVSNRLVPIARNTNFKGYKYGKDSRF